MFLLHAGLEIRFDEEHYSTGESEITGLSRISLSLKRTQAPFRMELIPTTIDVAETIYDLTDFLSLDHIADDQRAKSGEMCAPISHVSIKGYAEVYVDMLGLATLITTLQITTASHLEIFTKPVGLTSAQ